MSVIMNFKTCLRRQVFHFLGTRCARLWRKF
ncbi:hypothetical protein LEMLEM_LOCUS22467 [Lemmus lemmus]